ncbi:MAG: hypothetical protein J7J99_05770 [Thermoprotei archaeon]|nr:hypothetical protein [Thermoprotei archaeon]
MSSSKVKKSILTWHFTLTLIVVAVVVAVLTPIVTYYTPAWTYYAVAISGNIPLAIMFIALIIGNLFPERISNKHIALIVATSIMAILIPGARPLVPDVLDVIYGARTSAISEFFSLTFGPFDHKYMADIFSGHITKVPWGAWLPTLSWWAMYSVAWLLFMLALLSIVRRQWMDIEMLPYPIGYVWSVPLITASPERRAKGLPIDRRFAIYLAGLLVGFLYTFVLVLKLLVPWLPDILGWTNTATFVSWYPGAIAIQALPNLQRIVGLMVVPTNLIEYLTFLLAPLDILLSAWVVNIALLIVIQILYLRGYYSGIEKIGLDRFEILGFTGSLKIFAMQYGIIMGVGLFWLLLHAKYIGRTLKSAIAGPTREEVEREAITYRTAWFTILVCLVNLFILYYAAGVRPFGAFLIILQYFLLGLSIARIYGLSPIGSLDYPYYMLPTLYYDVTTAGFNPELVNALVLDQRMCTGELVFNVSYAAMFFRVAKDVDISPRDMFIALLIGALVGGILQWFVVLKLLYTVGYGSLPRGLIEFWISTDALTPDFPVQRPWWPQLLVGLIITGVLSYLRARFVWWPIDPVGAALGFGYIFGVPTGMFLDILQPFVPLVTWIIKYLVIKIGGVRVHDNVLVPFAAGVLSGVAICWFIGGIAILAIRVLPSM